MARSKKPIDAKTEIDAITHRAKRTNIPTEELRDFVAEDEKAPKVVLYPRDPSLDPQLVWKGKDEQDARDLEVPAVPIYIQEKIHPKVLIEDLRAQAKQDRPPLIADLFADFNGIKFEEQVDFYRHEQNWSNRMILGDSLLVMTSLAEKEGLKGKVQMIYIDPPYGIKFGSNWQVSTRKRDVKDGKVEDATRQPEQIKAFRDTWELGIHSYLAYLRDRLVAARELLTETGSVFVQIGDDNVHLVRSVMDEVFGSDNFISMITLKKTTGNTGVLLPGAADYVVWFSKNVECVKYRPLYGPKDIGGVGGTGYTRVELPDGTRRSLTQAEIGDPTQLPMGSRVYAASDLTSQSIGREKGEGAASWFAVKIAGQEYRPSLKVRWKTNEPGMENLLRASRVLVSGGGQLAYCRYYSDFAVSPLSNVWTDTVGQNQFGGDKIYVVQTGLRIIERCVLMTTDPGDLALDPTCGSGTTAHVAELWGRRWITIDTSRVALALARTRIMAARYPYYLLADSPEGQAKEAELAGRVLAHVGASGDVRKGFVYKRVPHITLKSIANSGEIDAIHEKWQPELDALRAKINKAARAKWEEWEIPRVGEEPAKPQAVNLKPLLDQWWALRRSRQQEIDASIARRADMETLYDQPYEDSKRIRVSGPFTVESLSPHRVMAADENLDGTVTEQEAKKFQDFSTMILANLKKAGVQNTIKQERLTFDTLEPFAGQWVHAKGTYTDADGKLRTVAVCIGPEHGTVGPLLVKEAAKEAVQGVGFDVLVVCGFAFDPHVPEETRRFGKLTVLPARMNPDLAMGEDLLKKTGAGNLFMVFGEPDVDLKKGKDGRVTVTIRGVDVYDPTTGEVRSHSTNDIACWFIDTDYNGESFFVRHAYFTGGEQPYEKLKRALKAEIDEAAWSALYRTESRPFAPPKSGRIAVKVINHYGDEVLKVFEA